MISPVAAVSVGMLGEAPLLDLCYEEDAQCDTDLNVIMNAAGQFIELQGTAEEAPFSRLELNQMLDLAEVGITQLIEAQTQVRA